LRGKDSRGEGEFVIEGKAVEVEDFSGKGKAVGLKTEV
jgi:hypothetical protein